MPFIAGGTGDSKLLRNAIGWVTASAVHQQPKSAALGRYGKLVGFTNLHGRPTRIKR
jgi:hypothetical protein